VCRLAVCLALLGALVVPFPVAAARMHWQPEGRLSWQIQFSGRIDRSASADVFDLDVFETSQHKVKRLHAAGRRVVCYINAGAWESWRPDAGAYPKSVKGRPLDGWPGERWLDIRQIDRLAPILRERIAICAAKGFDGVEFDNVDGYLNDTGFQITRADQLAFDRWLADEAHAAGLAVGLKNSLSLADRLEPRFDFAILEECFEYRECALVRPFLDAGKPVVDMEYALPRREFCDRAQKLGIFAMRKRLVLDAWRRAC
jgi:hypothetical protein